MRVGVYVDGFDLSHGGVGLVGGHGRPVGGGSTCVRSVCVKDQDDHAVPHARFMVSVARREEKGSDVNVASHLLIDTLQGSVDGAVVISNDSDLAYTVTIARTHIPVGLVNPSANYTAAALRSDRDFGVGSHWFHSVTESDLQHCQLPHRVANLTAPDGW